MKINLLLSAVASTFLVSTTLAVPVAVTSQDLSTCDSLLVPVEVDELGLPGVFPADELIDATDISTPNIACPSSANAGVVNRLVTITNLTNRSFGNLWYVADPETKFSNVDGLVNDQLAFKIDTVGLNRPLVSEDIASNGIFEPGESWEFIVDDYSNTNLLSASAFLSPGRVGSLSSPDTNSSASIIATPIPEPATCMLLVLGLTAIVLRRS